MRLRWKLLIALIILIVANYLGWWILIFPAAIFLYGAAGSVWEKVTYIPHDGDQGVTYYFDRDGERYRNSKGETHQMIESGKDNWAGRQSARINVELQRKGGQR